MGTDSALAMYEAFAAAYDDFNHLNDYEMWLGRTLLPALRMHGVKEGGRALDVGCGTGRAFPPLLEAGASTRRRLAIYLPTVFGITGYFGQTR